ncbi:hypothetical protein K474DRAFT_1661244 [Panus rudis PR-1116 ss-1]|nr:hypothetical protein K474DRAFT_1661244 [Panus rudis PR-1116 ss-1]
MSSGNDLDIVSLVIGVIGLITIVPLVYKLISSNFPSRRYEKLRKDYYETVDFFEQVTEEGLLPDQTFVAIIRMQLDDCHDNMEDIRSQTYLAATFVEQFRALCRGLSRRINHECSEVQKIRSKIVSTSEKERERLAELKRKRGDRSIFCARKSSDFNEFGDLHRGDFECALPKRPSSIHNDLVFPRVISVRRQSTLVEDTVWEKDSVEKLFLERGDDSTRMISEPFPMRPSHPPIPEAQRLPPIKADAPDNRLVDRSLVGMSSAAEPNERCSAASSTLAADTPTPFDPQAAAALASQLLIIQQQINTVTQLAQQVQERLGSSSTKQQ